MHENNTNHNFVRALIDSAYKDSYRITITGVLEIDLVDKDFSRISQRTY